MANEAYLIDTTDVAAWAATKFVPAVDGYWKEQLSLAATFANYSSLYTGGATTVKVPLVPLTASTTKTSGTVLVYGDLTDVSAGSITVTTLKAQPFLIEDVAQWTTDVSLFEGFMRAAGDRLAMDLDAACATAVKGQTSNTPITTATDNIILTTDFLIAQRVLNILRIKIKNCFLGIAPEAFELSVPDWKTNMSWTDAAAMGNGGSIFYNGSEGKVFGMQVFVDDNWDGGTTSECATIWHPQAVGYVTSGARMIGPTPEPLHVGYGATMYTISGAATLNAAGVIQIVND